MILEEAKQIKSELISWRHDIHQLAEVGLETYKTADYIVKELNKMGIEAKKIVNGAGVVATIGQGNNCILLRADMDALPMKEEVDLDFASDNGNMHACGHDLHATSLLGAAKLLKAHESELNGVVKMLFQPGEEIFKGAKVCIKEGVLENPKVNHAFALHVNSQLPMNVFSYGSTPMSSVFGFEIHLKGVGGHGSTPEMCIDPINTGVHIYLALQELIAREASPLDEVALTIGQFSAGSVANIIPNEAILKGTLRTFNPKAAKMMTRRIQEVAKGVCLTYRTEMEFIVRSECPSVICDNDMNRFVLNTIKQMGLDVEKNEKTVEEIALDAFNHPEKFYITKGLKAMASEDFAFITQQVPSGYYLLGAAMNDGSTLYGQHHPLVQFNDEALVTGAAIYASVAMNYMKQL